MCIPTETEEAYTGLVGSTPDEIPDLKGEKDTLPHTNPESISN